VKTLKLLSHIAECLEYEAQQGYRGDKEIILPPPAEELRTAWPALVKDCLEEGGWEATMQNDGCIKLKPQIE
jgi:hypothetical protein